MLGYRGVVVRWHAGRRGPGRAREVGFSSWGEDGGSLGGDMRDRERLLGGVDHGRFAMLFSAGVYSDECGCEVL